MKKNKFLKMGFMVVLLFGICGCSDNSLDDSKYFEVTGEDFICSALNDEIIDIDYELFITKNKVYKYNRDSLFSTNNENCIEVKFEDELDSDLVQIISGGVVSKNSTQYFISSDNVLKYTKIFPDQFTYKYTLEYNKSLDNNTLLYVIYEIDSVSLSSVENNLKYMKYSGNYVEKEEDIIENWSDDEIIEEIRGTVIKTNKAYYNVEKLQSNKEQCEKYADVECEYQYELVKDEKLTNDYDKIVLATNYCVLYKDNTLYCKKNG